MDSLFATAAPGLPSRTFLLNGAVNSLASPISLAAGAHALNALGIAGAYTALGAITLATGATLTINDRATASNPVNLTGTLSLGTSAWLQAGPVVFSGAGGASGGNVTGLLDPSYVAQGTVTQQGAVSISGAAYLSSSAGTTLAVSGAISGSGQLVISGAPGAPRSSAAGAVAYSRIRLESTSSSYTGGTVIRNTDASFFGGTADANQVWAASLGTGDVTLGANAFGGQAILAALGPNITAGTAVINFGSGNSGVYFSRFDLEGFSQSVGGLESLTSNSGAPNCAVTSTTGAPVLTITIPSGATRTFRGRINNAISLVKNGPGTQVLASASFYTGGTTINAGTLTLGNITALGTGSVTVNAGATLNRGGFAIANTIINNGGTVI